MERAWCLQGLQNPPAQAHHTKHSLLGLGQMEAQSTRESGEDTGTGMFLGHQGLAGLLSQGGEINPISKEEGFILHPPLIKQSVKRFSLKDTGKLGSFRCINQVHPLTLQAGIFGRGKISLIFWNKIKCKVENSICGQLKKKVRGGACTWGPMSRYWKDTQEASNCG